MPNPRFPLPSLRFAAFFVLASYAGSAAETRDAPGWRPIPLVTAAALAAGHAGGEGAQWPQAIAFDPVDGRVALMGTDVGGVFRSEDSGLTWQPANRGLLTRGVADFAFDPRAPSRVLLVAGNSLEMPFHGRFLSEDAGRTWRPVQPFANLGYRDFREQLAHDATSVGPEGYCRVAYWSAQSNNTRPGAVFKTEDGGVTWNELPDTTRFADHWLATLPGAGDLLLGGADGLWRSRDGGATFQNLLPGPISGLAVSAAAPDRVYALRGRQVWRSDDGGSTFRATAGQLPLRPGRSGAACLHASPAEPDRLIVDNDEAQWNWVRYVSADGGESFLPARSDPTPAFLPINHRQTVAAWHPTRPGTALSFGGDLITRTEDGGATWTYSNDGYNGLAVGNGFQFNLHDPDLVHLPSQDYNGAVTADGGRTWAYVNLSGFGWGGFPYGSYPFSASLIVAGRADGWGSPRSLVITTDGGLTRSSPGLAFQGADYGYGDPRDPRVAFLSDLRTADTGQTWTRIDGLRAVYTHDPATRELYAAGATPGDILRSTDHGATWRMIASLAPVPIKDLAFVPGRARLLVVSGQQKLLQLDLATGDFENFTPRLPRTWRGNQGADSIAVDPQAPDVLYVARPGNTYRSDASALRSLGGGATWQSLNTLAHGLDGGNEANWVRVHLRTREAWFATSSHGLWAFPPPNVAVNWTETKKSIKPHSGVGAYFAT